MAETYVIVREPNADEQYSLNLMGQANYTLVFDGKTKSWKVVKRKNLASYDQSQYVTLEKFKNGQNTVKLPTPTTPSAPTAKAGGYSGSTSDRVMAENAVNVAQITFEGGNPIVTFTEPVNPADKKAKPTTFQAYLYVDDKGGVSLSPDEARAGVTTSKTFNFDRTDAARDKHLNDLYKIYGSRQGIIDRLYKAGYLSTNKNVPTDNMLQALNAATAEYTVDQVEAYKAKAITEFQTLADWLGQRQDRGPESLAGTRTSSQITEFSDTDARAVIDEIASELLQRLPSEEEYAKLVPLIQQKQRKNPAITSTTTDEKGRVVATKTKTGINERQFLIEKLSKRDEAKANQVMAYYDAFKQAIGVR